MGLIIRGGDRFVDAATAVATLSGIPPFIIGATVVSLATTLPEIIVSLMAALSGQADMAAGNAIGSVTANTALILALSIVFLPGAVDRSRLRRQALLLIAAILLLWLTGLSGTMTLFGSVGLFLLFAVFLLGNIRSAKRDRTAAIGESAPRGRLAVHLLWFLFGAAEIILGSRLLVDNGSLIARDILHIDERVVSLTMVAVGTSLPELVTAVSAIIKRKGALTVGNILGANIIDILLILPLCCVAQGGALPLSRSTLLVDLPFCLLAVLIALLPALLKGRFYRAQGVLSILLYLLYTVSLFVHG